MNPSFRVTPGPDIPVKPSKPGLSSPNIPDVVIDPVAPFIPDNFTPDIGPILTTTVFKSNQPLTLSPTFTPIIVIADPDKSTTSINSGPVTPNNPGPTANPGPVVPAIPPGPVTTPNTPPVPPPPPIPGPDKPTPTTEEPSVEKYPDVYADDDWSATTGKICNITSRTQIIHHYPDQCIKNSAV
jgi:hypothetical protein